MIYLRAEFDSSSVLSHVLKAWVAEIEKTLGDHHALLFGCVATELVPPVPTELATALKFSGRSLLPSSQLSAVLGTARFHFSWLGLIIGSDADALRHAENTAEVDGNPDLSTPEAHSSVSGEEIRLFVKDDQVLVAKSSQTSMMHCLERLTTDHAVEITCLESD